MTVCQDDVFALILTLGHFFLAEYKVTGSGLWCVNGWDKALKESRLGSIKLLQPCLNDAPSPGLSARLMEGTALDCPLTDSCQPQLPSSQRRFDDVGWLTARKTDTQNTQSASADTHGWQLLWSCHLATSICREINLLIKQNSNQHLFWDGQNVSAWSSYRTTLASWVKNKRPDQKHWTEAFLRYLNANNLAQRWFLKWLKSPFCSNFSHMFLPKMGKFCTPGSFRCRASRYLRERQGGRLKPVTCGEVCAWWGTDISPTD